MPIRRKSWWTLKFKGNTVGGWPDGFYNSVSLVLFKTRKEAMIAAAEFDEGVCSPTKIELSW